LRQAPSIATRWGSRERRWRLARGGMPSVAEDLQTLQRSCGGPASQRWHADEMPSVLGVHHIRLPVVDVEASSDWYRTIFGFEILLYEEVEAGAVGAVLRHPSGVILGLHQVEAAVVAALEGFNALGLTADDLSAWADELDRLEIIRGEVTRSSVGYFIEVRDPNGTIVQLHTAEQPNVEEG